MEFKIIKNEKNVLLSRSEGTARLNSPTTPSYTELKKKLSEELKKEESLIKIKKIVQKFGSNGMDAYFYVYDNEEAFKRIEKEKKKKETAPAQ